jgi:diphthamide synthase (EF-2-diphthine--ammonia ligase)
MENLDIIILSTIISTLFVVFGIVIYNEFKNVPEQSSDLYERSPRANMIRFVGSLFDSESTNNMTKKEKETVYNAVKRTISDMESDGVYFSEDVKQQMEKKRAEMICEYSGLSSVKSYEV